MITAVSWLFPPPYPVLSFAQTGAAMAWLSQRLADGADGPDRSTETR
jgi:hypothetical protein